MFFFLSNIMHPWLKVGALLYMMSVQQLFFFTLIIVEVCCKIHKQQKQKHVLLKMNTCHTWGAQNPHWYSYGLVCFWVPTMRNLSIKWNICTKPIFWPDTKTLVQGSILIHDWFSHHAPTGKGFGTKQAYYNITNHLMSIGISLSIAHFLLNHDAITLIISLHCKEVSLILPVHV